MAYTTIDDPSAYFQAALWTGNGGTQSITNGGNSNMQPDWVWTKKRNAAQNHCVTDSNRGLGNILFPDVTDVESATQLLTSFDSDGFAINNNSLINQNTHTYVGWQWKANGGTTASNSDGNITSTVQANTDAGFSIVTYTGNGTDGHTVGHGLSGNWDLCILKNRDVNDYWTVSTTGTNQVLLLHDPSAQANHSTAYMTKSSGVIGLVGAGDLTMVNGSNEKYVAYVFKEIKGYSKFGKYVGNADNNGTFVYTGFSPAWLVIKRTDSTQQWNIHDNKRKTYNQDVAYLFANLNNAEATSSNLYLDFLSNGFRLRNGDDAQNNGTYLYLAFAHQPFVTSSGVPTTAK
jgi:hypothetical protein